MYSEDAYISRFFKLATINRFFETALHTYDALTLPERSLRQDLSGSYDVTSANFLTAWFALPPPPTHRSDQSLQYLHSTRTCYCAVIISSTISSNSVVKSSDGRFAISPQWQKPRVRPSERPAGLGLTSATFLASDRAQYRCGAQTFSLK